MKAWMVGTVVLVLTCIAALASSPVLTGTWIVKNRNAGNVQALVLTIGIGERGPLLRFRQVSAAHEGEELYAAIHEAASISQSKQIRHWGGGQSWCNGENCQRFYVFVGSSGGANRTPPAGCQAPYLVAHRLRLRQRRFPQTRYATD